jgi:hypothetical protein
MGATWFGVSAVKDLADSALKLLGALGLVAGGAVYLFQADVAIARPVGSDLPRRYQRCPTASQLRITKYAEPNCTAPGYFQAEIDRAVLREQYGARGVPLAIENLATEYDGDNERDLVTQVNSTATVAPFSVLCTAHRTTTETTFGEGFCVDGGPDQPRLRRLDYRGRTYERMLVLVNDDGADRIEPIHLSAPDLRFALRALHAAEYGVGRVLLRNFGRATATDVRIFPPDGYHPVSDGTPFALRAGTVVARRYETDRGDPPLTSERGFDIAWQTGKGEVPGGAPTVAAAFAVVVALLVVAAVRDATRRA